MIKTYDKPMLGQAGFAVLSGNLFDSAIMKTSVISPEFREKYLERKGDRDAFEGTAIVFEGPEDYHHRINDPKLPIDENSILFIRNAGPVGYPGAAEVVNMLPPDRLVKGGVLLLPCVGDGRQSGTSASPSILNASPEAAVGGGLALLKTGDKVRVDIGKRTANIMITDEELAKRKAAWKPNIVREPDAVAGAAAQVRRPARQRRLPRLRGELPEDRPDQGSAAALPLSSRGSAEEALLDRDRQVGPVDQDDRPRRGRLADGAGGRRRRRRREARRASAGMRRSRPDAPGGRADGAASRRPRRRRVAAAARALGHHHLGRHALLEDDDDAIAPAAGRQDVDGIAFAAAPAEEDADGVHAARLEHVGRGRADAAPQAAPLGDGRRPRHARAGG